MLFRSHSLFDMFAQFASADASPLLNWIGHGVMIVLTVLYCLYLIRRVDTPKKGGSAVRADVLN